MEGLGAQVTAIFDLLTGDLGKYLAGAIVAALTALGIYAKGRRDSTAKRDAKDARAYKTTTERMQDAEAAFGDDPAILRSRMRDRNPNQR